MCLYPDSSCRLGQDAIRRGCPDLDKERNLSRDGENVRVRRTRKLLRDALIELIEEHGFDALTVGRITEQAMVSRAAFYRNYRDKYHLVEQIFDDAMDTLLSTVDGSVAGRWTGFFDHIAEHERFYRAMLGTGGSSWFAARMRTSLARMSTAHLGTPEDDLAPTVLGAMFVQSITWWLEHDRPVPASLIAARSGRMARLIIEEANGWGREG
jgi:AcrR family transcriptional regulator